MKIEEVKRIHFEVTSRWSTEELEEIKKEVDAFVECLEGKDQGDCHIKITSSRVCEYGTLGCNVKHDEEG